MSERRLTTEELRDFAEYCEGNDCAMRVIAELRELRALLATPMPCGWPVPEHIELETMPPQHRVRWESLDAGLQGIDPDEAVALGSALIRAAQHALAAKGQK